MYQAASATTYAEPSCLVTGEDESSMTVECETQMALGMHRAINSSGIPATVTIRMTPDGIATMDSAYGANLGLLPFYAWVVAHRAGELPVDDEEHPLTLEGVTELARTETRLASEWADWAVAVAEDTLADFDAGDPDTFFARFPGRPSGTVAGLSKEAISGWMADGVQLAPSSCAPDGTFARQLAVVCEVSGTEVAELVGTWRLHIDPDGWVVNATIEPS